MVIIIIQVKAEFISARLQHSPSVAEDTQIIETNARRRDIDPGEA